MALDLPAARAAVESVFRDSTATVVTSGGACAIVPLPLALEIVGAGGVLRRLDPPVRRTFGVVRPAGQLPPAAAAFLETARAWAEQRAGQRAALRVEAEAAYG